MLVCGGRDLGLKRFLLRPFSLLHAGEVTPPAAPTELPPISAAMAPPAAESAAPPPAEAAAPLASKVRAVCKLGPFLLTGLGPGFVVGQQGASIRSAHVFVRSG